MSKNVYFHENGQPSHLPTSLEEAKRYRKLKHYVEDECPSCTGRGDHGQMTKIRYTSTGECHHCAQIAALDFYNLAIYASASYPHNDDDKQIIWFKRDDKETVVSKEYFNRLKSALLIFEHTTPAPHGRTIALEQKCDYYVYPEPCSKAGHYGVRITHNNDCYFCEKQRQTLSPRQAAINDNQTWYTPTQICPKCNTLSERHVDNGKCKGCIKPKSDSRMTPDSIMMRENPSMILSYEDASRLEMKVYRTGNACRRGHKGYRYTSTKNCIDCLKT